MEEALWLLQTAEEMVADFLGDAAASQQRHSARSHAKGPERSHPVPGEAAI